MRFIAIIGLGLALLTGCSAFSSKPAGTSDKMQFPLAFPEDQDKVSEPLFCSLTDKEAVRLLKQGAYYCNLEANTVNGSATAWRSNTAKNRSGRPVGCWRTAFPIRKAASPIRSGWRF